ncbi:DNA polymerase III subunit gamma/tau [Cognatiluteimonas profundi]|uniref:DNA polymerase III subunit gamma/tau n=1 Tax=Cognatiluteimonas profundi TaxID=2594501 RepID=UPI00131D0821|nr:DNA polymerase III subunit gamma/tau [Lysobacter profundi]
MSYLVLARKWRPKRFAELVGQEHVVRALTNALDTGRVHHAFLFTGTRGVGKTTIARIFAKSLNCERGTSAEPCGECNSCRDIDAGRFIDLLEIDAASNTGVDDVREVIENAQYMPSRGRVKVYLIDEVHMLSKAAFNALLKTLEEPPGHVKFLLATTDPQKLPVTVLSRCLQFNLKRLDEQQIGGQINMILQAEGIAVDADAVRQLSKAADGSLRDGLSLLDQAIAYTGASGEIALEGSAVATMLGTVDRSRVGLLLSALGAGDGGALMAEISTLAEFSPDWNGVLDAFADALHRVQVKQLVPDIQVDGDAVDVDALATQLRPELVQLWYQMALNARRDLSFAPSARAGFEMAMLRMLAFRPSHQATQPTASDKTPRVASASAARAALDAPQAAAKPPAPVARPAVPAPAIAVPVVEAAPRAGGDMDAERWLGLVADGSLRGPARELAVHAGFVGYADGVLRLSLSPLDEHLQAPNLTRQLAESLAPALGGIPQIRFESTATSAETLHQRSSRAQDARQSQAESAFMADAGVQQLINQHGAAVVPDSIRPLDD